MGSGNRSQETGQFRGPLDREDLIPQGATGC